jgi:hypothetical protein
MLAPLAARNDAQERRIAGLETQSQKDETPRWRSRERSGLIGGDAAVKCGAVPMTSMHFACATGVEPIVSLNATGSRSTSRFSSPAVL